MTTPHGSHLAGQLLDALVLERSVVVCCGSGGVGKTTTAAAIALRAAERGRRACVVTIDPARRLANALGLDALTNDPTQVDGPWSGALHALMLDPKGTFDDLVHRYAATEEQAEVILGNRIYRNLTGALSGTQEYMAMEKLYELVEEGDFDVVVVDTPPTRNALDFLDAPRRLTHFLDNRIFRALMMPTRASLRVMGIAAQALLRTISKVAGADIVHDAVTFFQAFDGMEQGFRARAERVRAVLAEPSTAFVLVASPRADSIDEASHFAGKLGEMGVSVAALVVNRVQPRFVDDDRLADLVAQVAEVPADAPLRQLVANLEGYTAASDRDEEAYGELVVEVAPAPVARVPLLNTDVHDLDGLGTVTGVLFGGIPTEPSRQPG